MKTEDEKTLANLIATAARKRYPNRAERRGTFHRTTLPCPACGITVRAKNASRHATRCPKLPTDTDG